MFPFLEIAHAMPPGGGGNGASALGGFIPLILVFAIFWFLVIRPQQKRAREHRELVAKISKGDEVVTDGGIYGTIQRVGESSVTLEIAPKVSIRIQRSRISERLKESREGRAKEIKGPDENGGNGDDKQD